MRLASVRSALALAMGVAILTPRIVLAQSNPPPLAEVAKKEAERRKGIKEAQKVITTKDLPESARKPKTGEAASADGSAPATAAGPNGEQKTEAKSDGGNQKDEKYWRMRVAQTNENLRRNEAFLEALQSRVNGLTTDFVNRDDPYQRQKIGEDRQKALAEMERVKAEIELAKKQISDLEEEARKAGVPPGWLR
jgi:hypothetical protein